MWKLKLCVVFVVGIVWNGVSGRILADSQSQDDVGIVGGAEVDIKQYPYQVSLVYGGYHFCGGSIISEQYVLTAAHCVDGRDAKNFQIRAGSTYKKGGVLYPVESIVPHPKYSRKTYDFDMAIMKISGEIETNGETIDIVTLAEADSELNTGDLVTVSGWGDTTGEGDYSDVLKAVTLPVFDKNNCYKVWKKQGVTITDRMVCAGFKEPGKSACYGDSGGPLVDENLVQYGVVSIGAPGCQGRDLPNVYSSVANLRSWILENTGVIRRNQRR